MSRTDSVQEDQLLNIKAVITCGSNELPPAFFSINLLSSLNLLRIVQRWHLHFGYLEKEGQEETLREMAVGMGAAARAVHQAMATSSLVVQAPGEAEQP